MPKLIESACKLTTSRAEPGTCHLKTPSLLLAADALNRLAGLMMKPGMPTEAIMIGQPRTALSDPKSLPD